MKLKNIKMGIHTIELYAGNLKYHQIQKVIDQLVEQKSIQRIFSDPYSIDRHLKSTYLVDQGKEQRSCRGTGVNLFLQAYQLHPLFFHQLHQFDDIFGAPAQPGQ